MRLLRVLLGMGVVSSAMGAMAGQISLPTTLDQLLPDGDFAVVGDLAFDEFTYIQSGDMPSAVQINVEALDGVGLRFTGPFLDLPGGVGNGASDATLGFTVESATALTAVTLAGNPSLTGATGNATVTETFAELPTVKLDIFDMGGVQTRASADIPPSNRLTVVKDVLLLTTDGQRSATLSVIDQTFGVPEPDSGKLALMLLVAPLLARRRRARHRRR